MSSQSGAKLEVGNIGKHFCRRQKIFDLFCSGVLMMGYELYRQLANRKPRRKRSKMEPRQEEKEDKMERKILAGKISTLL